MVRFYPTVEIAPGADLASGIPTAWSWTDITSYVHQSSKITITRGRRDRYAQTSPSTCALTLLNPAGIWCPDNPRSDYYGRIDQNTPLRVSNRPIDNSLSDAFNRTASSSWGSADSGGAWTNSGGSASDFSVSAANGGRHLHTSASVRHYSRLSLSILRTDQRVKVRVNALSTGAAQTAGLIARYVDASNWARGEVRFNTDGTMTARIVQQTGGVDTGVSEVSTLTHSTSTWYWMRLETGYNSARFKVWQDGTAEPTTWILDGADSPVITAVAGTHGVETIRETGNTNANATIDFDSYSLVDGPLIQFTGYIDQWPVAWADASESVSLAQITASGQLRRIGRGKAFKSALHRAYTQERYGSSPKAIAYWPGEDESGSTQVASALGGPPMTGAGVSFAADSSIAGSAPLMTLAANAAIVGNVPTYPASTSWSIQFVCKIPNAPAATTILADWRTPGGTIGEWQLRLVPGSPDTLRILGWNNAGTELLADTGASFSDGTNELYGRQLQIEVSAAQNGADIDWSYTVYYGDVGSGKVGTRAAATIANVTQVYFPPDSNLAGITLGHIAVGSSPFFGIAGYGATGFAGESTYVRFTRLCTEENTPNYFGEILGAGLGDTTQLMGPQRTTDMLAQLREVEATEEGILFDGKQGQVTLLPRLMRQNHAVNLALNHNLRQVAWPFAAIRDDALLRTDVTVSRVGGSSANKADVTAVRQVGVYTDTVQVNTATDADLANRANWRLNQGSTREIRYPQVPLNFARSPELIADWLQADIGARVTVSNLPAQLPPDTLDLLVEGYTEVMDSSAWTATLNTSPARPWDVWSIEGSGNLGRVDSSGSKLGSAVSAGATTLQVVTTTGAQWSAATPYDVSIAGERVTFTTVGTAVSDAFGRTVSNGWASEPTSGVAYATSGGSASDFAVGSGVGTQSLGSVNAFRNSLLDIGASDVDFRVDVSLPVTSAATSTITQWVCGRLTDVNNYYVARLDLATSGAVTLLLAKRVAGTLTTLVGSQTVGTGHVSGDSWRVRLQCIGSTIQAKAWMGGSTAEPGSWQATATDTALTTGTSIGLLGRLESGNTNTLPVVVSWDNLVVLNPQRATVTRAVNGVSKAQAAGAAINLWRQGVLAL